MKMVDESTHGYVWLVDKKIVVEERFGEHHDIVKKYRVTSLSKTDDYLVNYKLFGSDFISSSPIRCLSKSFLKQIVDQIKTPDEEFASSEL